jgi:hypothetical protein
MTMTIDIASFAGTVGGVLFVIAGFQLFCLIHLYFIASHIRGYQLEISNCWKLFAHYSIIVNKGDTVIVHGIVVIFTYWEQETYGFELNLALLIRT